jgi:filamentous hemagglutinin family protein
MNKSFNLVWSESSQQWVVAHEHARTRGKGGARKLLAVGALVIGAQLAVAGPPVPTVLPQGAQIAAGAATVLSPALGQLNITQSTPKAIINWNSFDIGSQAKVNFVQPSASASVLNRVLSTEPTQISGQLAANGQVYIVNPNGIVFGAGSRVDTGALVASTFNTSDANFMAGNNRFERGSSTASVSNQGSLNAAPGGYVALLGASVVMPGRSTPQRARSYWQQGTRCNCR